MIADYLLANGVTIRRKKQRGIGPIRTATNADRIRLMSDEELAWFMAEKFAKDSILRIVGQGSRVSNEVKNELKN